MASNFINIIKFFILSVYLQIVNCQSSSGRIGGIGIGTFIIILAIAFSVLWCLACRSSSYP